MKNATKMTLADELRRRAGSWIDGKDKVVALSAAAALEASEKREAAKDEALRSYIDEHGRAEAVSTGMLDGCKCAICKAARAALAAGQES